MPEQDEEQLGAMLREFLRDSLDGQQGRAGHCFRRYLDTESKAAWRNRSFLIGAFISGLAASVAVLWATPIFHTAGPASPLGPVARGDTRSNLVQPVVERLVSSRTSDEGIVMLDDDTPVRVYHHQTIEQTRWFDEHEEMKAQEVQPRDDLLFVKLVTY